MDMSRIDRTIEIAAPLEKVWHALTTAKEIATWFRMTVEGDVVAGHDLWMTHEGRRFKVRIIEMTPPHRFVWQWHPGAIDPAVDYSQETPTTVTFTLEPTATGTRLSMAETGFDEISLARRAKVYADNTGGWKQVVVWIQQHAEAAH
jgi:uncharacterized protein YndB with AHSA1/START domain